MITTHPVELTPAVLESIHQCMTLKQGPLGNLTRIEFHRKRAADSPHFTTLWLAYNPDTGIIRVFFNRDKNDISTADIRYLETVNLTGLSPDKLTYSFDGYKHRHVMQRFKTNYERELVKQAFRAVITTIPDLPK